MESVMSQYMGIIDGILQPAELAKPFFNDEGGYATGQWAAPYTDDNMQASFISRFYIYSASLNISNTTWGAWNQFGLGGTAPSPAASTAYTQTFNWMVGSTVPTCSVGGQNGTTWICTMTFSNNVPAEAIWDTSQTCTPCTYSTTTVSNAWSSYLDLTGASPHQINGNTISVGIQPILLMQK
jgi:hypothetical protein